MTPERKQLTGAAEAAPGEDHGLAGASAVEDDAASIALRRLAPATIGSLIRASASASAVTL
jgi:hypothetical protein